MADEGMSDFVRQMTQEVNSTPLTEPLFMELFEISHAAMTGKLRSIPPDEERCLEDMPPGSYYLTDARENQMGLAIIHRCKEKFGEEEGERIATSFLHRWFSVMKAKHEGWLDEFIKPCDQEGMITIHDGVFRAAGTTPLENDGHFNRDQYVAKIREIIRTEEDGKK